MTSPYLLRPLRSLVDVEARRIECTAKALYERYHLRKSRPVWGCAPEKTRHAFRCDAIAILDAAYRETADVVAASGIAGSPESQHVTPVSPKAGGDTAPSRAPAQPATCRDCGGLVNDDGMTIDPDKCCFYCKAD